MSNTVKFLHSDLSGAPVLSGTAGAMIALLDACLVNGWGTATVDSIVIAGGIATVTRGAGHPFEVDMVSEISGAVVSSGTINGQQKVLTSVGNTYTFAAPGISDQTATGTPSHKVASLGWTKPYSGTNLAAYRAPDVDGTRFYLRVDDTGTLTSRVVGYEAMTGISAGTNAFPLETQQAGGLYWGKSANADANARRWVLFGNGKCFYLAVNWSNNTGANLSLYSFFGDLIPAGSTDSYRCVIHGNSAASLSTPGAMGAADLDSRSTTAGLTYAARSYSGLGVPVSLDRYYPNFRGSPTRSGDTSTDHLPLPNPTDGGLYVAPWFSVQNADQALRGRWPGFYAFPQRLGSTTFAHRARLTDLQGLTGRRLALVNSNTGAFSFDVTGPWD